MLLRGNYDVKLLFKCTPFYAETLQYWHDAKYLPVTADTDGSNQQLFYNKCIRINGKMFYNKAIFEAGIWYVKDLFDIRDNIAKRKDYNNLGLSLTDRFQLNSIVSALPKRWKKTVKDIEYHHHDDCVLFEGNITKITLLSSKQIKEMFTAKKRMRPTAQIKYNNDFIIDDDVWKEIYMLPKNILFDNEVYETQFKMLHNYIPTNRLLYKMKKFESDKCNFCSLYSQSLYHLVYDCLIVKNFWLSVEQQILEQYFLRETITKYDVLFGHVSKKDPVVKIIMYGKQYIWNCKMNENIPVLNTFMIYFNDMMNYENVIKNKLRK